MCYDPNDVLPAMCAVCASADLAYSVDVQLELVTGSIVEGFYVYDEDIFVVYDLNACDLRVPVSQIKSWRYYKEYTLDFPVVAANNEENL